MQRYLLKFNYKGTNFRGSQKILAREATEHLSKTLRSNGKAYQHLKEEDRLLLAKEEQSVQGAIETAVDLNLKPVHPAIAFISSRTDSGVHAFMNTCAIDLKHPRESHFYDPSNITFKLNLHFKKRKLDLRIDECLAVHPTFNARADTCSRTYLYQIVTTSLPPHEIIISCKKPVKRNYMRSYMRKFGSFDSRLPITIAETYSQVKESEFDIQRMQETLSMFKGSHNFKSFCKALGWVKSSKVDGIRLQVNREKEEFVKTIHDIQINQVPSPLPASHLFDTFKFYHVKVKGRAFLHNQVRRMIGAGLSVCNGRISTGDVKNMLEDPELGYHKAARPAMSHGLFLMEVEYTQDSLKYSTSNVEDLPVPSVDQEN